VQLNHWKIELSDGFIEITSSNDQIYWNIINRFRLCSHTDHSNFSKLTYIVMLISQVGGEMGLQVNSIFFWNGV
jgi:hypothetical protein